METEYSISTIVHVHWLVISIDYGISFSIIIIIIYYLYIGDSQCYRYDENDSTH